MRKFFLSAGPVIVSALLLAGLADEGRAASATPGTKVRVRLNQKLDTEQTQSGQAFTANLAQPLVVGGRTIARGTLVKGRVIEAVSSGRLRQPALFVLELTELGSSSVRTEPLRIDERSHLVRNVELIGGGAAAGTLLGAVAGGKKGAAIGAAAGAGAGAATAYLTGKKEIVLPAEMALTFVVASASGGAVIAAGPAPRDSVRRHDRDYDEDEDRDEREEWEERGEGRGPVFTERDRSIIIGYFRGSTANLPPGLAKRGGNLPPGLEKHLARNGTLPPGLQKRVQPFPVELERRLPRLPATYSRVTISGRAMILDRNNRIIDLVVIYNK